MSVKGIIWPNRCHYVWQQAFPQCPENEARRPLKCVLHAGNYSMSVKGIIWPNRCHYVWQQAFPQCPENKARRPPEMLTTNWKYTVTTFLIYNDMTILHYLCVCPYKQVNLLAPKVHGRTASSYNAGSVFASLSAQTTAQQHTGPCWLRAVAAPCCYRLRHHCCYHQPFSLQPHHHYCTQMTDSLLIPQNLLGME